MTYIWYITYNYNSSRSKYNNNNVLFIKYSSKDEQRPWPYLLGVIRGQCGWPFLEDSITKNISRLRMKGHINSGQGSVRRLGWTQQKLALNSLDITPKYHTIPCLQLHTECIGTFMTYICAKFCMPSTWFLCYHYQPEGRKEF